MRFPFHKTILFFILFGINSAYANLSVPVFLVQKNGENKNVGRIELKDSFCGIILTPKLHDLPPGIHGLHIHEKASCDNHGEAAGGHLDPGKTGEHRGPYASSGHLGDLPVLIVDQQGQATLPALAPRLRVKEAQGHAIMIHAGGDNYSDEPEKLGGGGARLACGVIPAKES